LIAEKTGRSGQPTQKPGGRSGRPTQHFLRQGAAGARRSKRSRGRKIDVVGRLGEEFQQAVGHHFGGVFTRHRQHVLAVEPGVDVALAQDGVDRLLDVVGSALLDDQHSALALAEIGDLVGHQRMRDVQHQGRNLAFDLETVEATHQDIGDAALHDDAEVGAFAGQELVQVMLDDEALGGGSAHLDVVFSARVKAGADAVCGRRLGEGVVFRGLRCSRARTRR
jgi:hypothetical protein